MPHCVAFGCNKQTKYRAFRSMLSQKMKDFAKLGFERSEGRHCQKILVFALNILKPAATRIESDLRVNSSVRALGKESSSRMLSPRSSHTKNPRILVLPAENEQRKNNDKRFVPKTRDLSLEI